MPKNFKVIVLSNNVLKSPKFYETNGMKVATPRIQVCERGLLMGSG